MSTRAEVRTEMGPFAIVPLWLIESGVSAQAIRAYSMLAAKWADRDTGKCYPSHQTIADALGVASSTSRAALDELKAVGALTAEIRKNGKHNLPTLLTIRQTPADPPADPCRPTGNKPESSNQKVKGSNEEEVVEEPETNDPSNARARKNLTAAEADLEFDTEFWPAYPRKGGKNGRYGARGAFKKARTRADLDTILVGLGRAIVFWTKTGKIKNGRPTELVPLASTWLNQDRWEDDLDFADNTPGMESVRGSTAAGRKRMAEWAPAFNKPKVGGGS